MLRGFYTAASGMYAQQRKTDLLTNNLSNMNTPGFKEDQAVNRAFPEMLLQRMGGNDLSSPAARQVGAINTGTYLQETLPRFIQGDLRETGNKTDLALTDLADGMTFFTVQNNDQVRYTRNGSLTLDANGVLTTAEGFPVLDQNGEQILLDNDQFTVLSNGVIQQDGVQVAQLGIAITDDPSSLIKEGNGLYRTENNEALQDAQENTSYKVSQGFIEGSNVDATRAMSDMLSAYRTFEANQKVLQAYDRSMEKAVNEIGRVNG